MPSVSLLFEDACPPKLLSLIFLCFDSKLHTLPLTFAVFITSLIYSISFLIKTPVFTWTGFKNVVKKYFAPENPKAAIAKIEEHRAYLPILMEHYREFYPESELTWQPIYVDYGVRFFAENKDLLQGIPRFD